MDTATETVSASDDIPHTLEGVARQITAQMSLYRRIVLDLKDADGAMQEAQLGAAEAYARAYLAVDGPPSADGLKRQTATINPDVMRLNRVAAKAKTHYNHQKERRDGCVKQLEVYRSYYSALKEEIRTLGGMPDMYGS